jgi:hypothetical protein
MARRRRVVPKEQPLPDGTVNKPGEETQRPDPVVPVEDAVNDTAPVYENLGLKKK